MSSSSATAYLKEQRLVEGLQKECEIEEWEGDILFKVIRQITHSHFGEAPGFYDEELKNLLGDISQALADGDHGKAAVLLGNVKQKVEGVSNTYTSKRLLTGFADRFLGEHTSGKKIPTYQDLWFELVHSWRGFKAKGVPLATDASKFSIIEAVLVGFCVGIGVVYSTFRFSGISCLLPLLCFALFAGLNALMGFAPLFSQRILVFLILAGAMIFAGIWWHDSVVLHNLVYSWTGGSLTGAVIATHLVYLRCVRLSNKYGPFACLWSRKLGKRKYEVILFDSDGNLVWHHITTRLQSLVEPVVCNSNANYIRAHANYLRNAGQNIEWIACYPALVATRMNGLRRWNPPNWKSVTELTPGVDWRSVANFFNNLPSLVEPQGYTPLPESTVPVGPGKIRW